MPVLRPIRHRQELFAGVGKVDRHARTEIRQRAARVNERQPQRLAFELPEMNRLAEFVGERIIRHRVADVQRVHEAHAAERLARRRFNHVRCAGFCDLINPSLLIRDEQAEGNFVARLKAREFVGDPRLERHGHRRHIIRDLLVLDDDRPAVRLQFLDHALDGENLCAGL